MPTDNIPRHTTLSEQLLSASIFPKLLADSEVLVIHEMRKKGLAVRAGFKLMCKARPDLVSRAMRELLPEFVEALEPYYHNFKHASCNDFHAYMLSHQSDIAAAFLKVSDHRVSRANSRTVKKGYRKIRLRARREVVQALPCIIDIVAKYAT